MLSNCIDPDPQDIDSDIRYTSNQRSFVLNDDGTFTYDHDCSDDPDESFFTYFVTDGEDTTRLATQQELL